MEVASTDSFLEMFYEQDVSPEDVGMAPMTGLCCGIFQGKKKSLTAIASDLDISKAAVGQMIKSDSEYQSEKVKRSEERKETRQEKTLASIRAKRAAAQAKKAPKKPQRDPRFTKEERDAWEWLVRITNATAVAKKKRGVSGSDLAHDFVHSGIQNVMDDNVWIGGVQAHVTNDIRSMTRQAYSRRSMPAQIEVLDDLEYSTGCGKKGHQGGHSGRTGRFGKLV